MLLTLTCGYIQMFYPIGFGARTTRTSKPAGFYRHMCVVGGLRFVTVLFGLVALDYIAVSFTETVKSSAPAFTVIISRLLLGQTTGMYVKLSLVPVMGGLALCSANELSYNLIGFAAALLTNVSECCQNVYSKMLISGDGFKLNPAELQFYTSIASIAITIPTSFLLMDWSKVLQTDLTMLFFLIINGVFYHFQTISAYVLMDYISPVTHSVANTGKRAVLIWSSILLFGNPVTTLSALGTFIVILGVLLYNIALQVDAKYHRVIQLGAKKMFVEKI
jgi:solute carrier family 35 protein E2